MFRTYLYANTIAVLADTIDHRSTIHFFFGYGVYYYRHILEVCAKRRNHYNNGEQDSTNSEDLAGSVLLSFVWKISSLLVSRTTAWIASSAGECLGTTIFPGWGTIVATQLGDVLAGIFEST